MQNSALFGFTGFLALACFITVYFTRKWPRGCRYGLLVIGNMLIMIAAYLDPWWHLGEWDDRRDLVLWFALNAVLIPRIVRDGKAAPQGAGEVDMEVKSGTADPPAVVMIALTLTAMFFFWSFGHQSNVRTVIIGGLLAATGVATYTHRRLAKPSRNLLIVLACVVILVAVLVRFGHSPWVSSFLTTG